MELNTSFVNFLIESGTIAVTEDVLWAEFERRRAEKKKQQARVYNRKYYNKKKQARVAKEAEPEHAEGTPEPSKTDAISS
jgi:hypothetical protein